MINFDIRIGVMIGIVLSSGTVLFIYCYAALKSTECYLQFGDILFDSNWTELPIEFQKFIFVIIMDTQKPMLYRAYSFANFNLETFIKVNLYATYRESCVSNLMKTI